MGILDVDGEKFAQNISDFRTIPVLSPNDFLLTFVVVTGGEKMSEDHFGNHNFLFRVHVDGDAVAIIFNGNNGVTFTVGGDSNVDVFDGGHASGHGGTHVFVAGIDNDFIKDFVETWIELDLAPYHFARRRIKEPTNLLIGLGATHVRIRKLKNVLMMRVFLVRTGGHDLDKDIRICLDSVEYDIIYSIWAVNFI